MKIKELQDKSDWITINLSHNEIAFINFPELTRQTRLESLTLNNNSQIGGDGTQKILEHKTLKNFECQKCGFTEISSEHFNGLDSLTKLLLNGNQINRINESAFQSNGNLQFVDLSENQLKKLPYATFAATRHFKNLYLTNNPIELPVNKSFFKSESLKILVMDGCNITAIYSHTFGELPALEVLNLNRNHIEGLPLNSLTINSKLKSLMLESNRLRTFGNLDFLKTLTELCLDGNPFDCNFQLEFSKFVTKYREKSLRTDSCSDDTKSFVEWLCKNSTTDSPQDEFTETTSKIPTPDGNKGISDFFIGSYITLILVIQAVIVVLLTIYLIKITKYEILDGEVNYSNTILNDDEIYRVYKTDE